MAEGFADLADLGEDERIEIVVTFVNRTKKTAGVIVEDDAKADRYLRKMGDRVRLIRRGAGLVPGSIMLTVGAREPQARCDHKFIDSAKCVKCGWEPT